MDILIAEDDVVSRRMLEVTLQQWGYHVRAVCDGRAALDALESEGAPSVAILDWMMPGLDGVEVCKRIRAENRPRPPYLILLTARSLMEDLVAGLESGADDFIAKPFNREELQARVRVGFRVAGLQKTLADRVEELEKASLRVEQLQGLLPICSYCKSIRNDQHYWLRVEEYITSRADVEFSHAICPTCYDKFVLPDVTDPD